MRTGRFQTRFQSIKLKTPSTEEPMPAPALNPSPFFN